MLEPEGQTFSLLKRGQHLWFQLQAEDISQTHEIVENTDDVSGKENILVVQTGLAQLV